jgi:hypothetical protein
MPLAARRCVSFSFKSSNCRPGRSTKEVSSKKILFALKGMAYRNVGWSLFCALNFASKCPSLQSMNSISSRGNPCGSSVSHTIPNAAWYPGVKSRSNSTIFRTCPVASRTILACTVVTSFESDSESESGVFPNPFNTTTDPFSSCVTVSTTNAPNCTPRATHRSSSLF